MKMSRRLKNRFYDWQHTKPDDEDLSDIEGAYDPFIYNGRS